MPRFKSFTQPLDLTTSLGQCHGSCHRCQLIESIFFPKRSLAYACGKTQSHAATSTLTTHTKMQDIGSAIVFVTLRLRKKICDKKRKGKSRLSSLCHFATMALCYDFEPMIDRKLDSHIRTPCAADMYDCPTTPSLLSIRWRTEQDRSWECRSSHARRTCS